MTRLLALICAALAVGSAAAAEFPPEDRQSLDNLAYLVDRMSGLILVKDDAALAALQRIYVDCRTAARVDGYIPMDAVALVAISQAAPSGSGIHAELYSGPGTRIYLDLVYPESRENFLVADNGRVVKSAIQPRALPSLCAGFYGRMTLSKDGLEALWAFGDNSRLKR